MSTGLWADAAAYERYVGRWSRPVGRAFLAWLEAPRGVDWVDVGCGTGALTASIAEVAAPRSILGVDPSEGFLALAREQAVGQGIRYAVGSATDIPATDG